jgi:hypothetical protein
MTVPVVNAVINFSTGPAFAQAMILDQGILGTNVLADSAAVIVDVSNRINRIETNRGRTALSDLFQTGTMTLRIVDQNGEFNPQNPASPYFTFLTPMKKVQITATFNGITYPVFSGFITSYVTTYPDNSSFDDVAITTIQAVDAFRLAQLAQISTVTGASAGDLSGTRINEILDEIDWPQSMRDIDAGLTTLQADPGTNRTALQALTTATESEYGALYVDGYGSFVFQDRVVTVGSIAGTPTLFADDGTGIDYFNASWILNDVLVFNKATITRVGGTAQVATNQASIDKYFLHSYFLNNLLMESDAVALDYAQAYVASRAETSIRCDAIVLDLYTPNYDTGVVAALDLDFFDPITVLTTQPGGSTIEKTLQIFGVRMNITPNSWKTTFTTLEPVIDGFIIGNVNYGVLDQNVLSY